MIDIQSHILPGLDDGAKSLKETMIMANKAVKQGIDMIIATPSHHTGRYYNEKEAIIGAVDYVNAKLQQERIPLLLVPGQEIHIYPDVVIDLQQQSLLQLNESTGYVLLALPKDHIPPYTEQVLFDMQIAGYKPVLSHPELNQEIADDPDKLYEMVKNGALVQLNASSITGSAGKREEKLSIDCLKANLAHFVASDARDAKKQGCKLKQAYKLISKKLDESTTELLKENSELLVRGNPILKDAPSRINQRKGLFR